uniref:Uncharacterized protein n=1 Tax=Panagrolaimus superbus TaxID=310955 RepID=A0A914YYK0_9BILA
MTTLLLLLINGLILNLNEFCLLVNAEEGKSERTNLRSFRHSTPPFLIEEKEEGVSTLTIIYILIGLVVIIAIGLGIIGYIVYLKCYKKAPPKPPNTPEKFETTPPTYHTDVLNHPSTFCEASTIAPPAPDVIGGKGKHKSAEEEDSPLSMTQIKLK